MEIDLENSWEGMFENIIDVLPKIGVFLLILLVGWIIAKVLEKVTNAILERVGFDRAVERGGVGRSLERSRYDASDIVAKIVYLALILVTLVVAFNVFGPNPVTDLLSSVIAWLPRLLVAVVLIVIAAFIANMVRELLSATLSAMSFGGFLAMAAYAFIIGLGIIAALAQIGVATAVTLPILIFLLATVGGVIVVGVGGGMVRPMQSRWDRWLTGAEAEAKAATPLRAATTEQERMERDRMERERMERQTGTTLPPAAGM